MITYRDIPEDLFSYIVFLGNLTCKILIWAAAHNYLSKTEFTGAFNLLTIGGVITFFGFFLLPQVRIPSDRSKE